MKSFLIIGMNTFGHHLCRELYKQNGEVMIADINEEALADALSFAISAKVGDCTNVEVLRSFGVGNFDACFVCISSDFQNSLEVTSLLKELGARKVISKADNDVHAKFLLRNGADSVIYPEREAAQTIAVSESSDSIFDCIPLTADCFIYEILPMKEWVGKSMRQLNLRVNYNVSVLAIKRGNDMDPMPTADYIIREDEHLVVLCNIADIRKIT